MESITIQPNDSVSIDDLVALKAEGFSVLRSAHVGNLSPYNLTLASVGIPMLLVDHNKTGVDKNYFPESVLSQDGEVRVAEDGKLVSRVRLDDGRFLDELHIAAITEALPEADVFTNTEYLRQNEVIAGEVALLAARNFPELFQRIVRPDGEVESSYNAAAMLGRVGVIQLSDNPRAERSAILLPNVVEIVINFVIEALNSDRDVQYHLSGPDMITYVKDKRFQKELQKLFAVVKRDASFGARLPDQLVVQLVPTAEARFATSLAYQGELEALLEQFDASTLALRAINQRRKSFFDSGAGGDYAVRQEFLTAVRAEEATQGQLIADKIDPVPGLLLAPKQTGFVTQYDVIRDGGLFVAPENTRLPIAQLTALTKRLAAIQRGTGP